jgi:hypothetical protein
MPLYTLLAKRPKKGRYFLSLQRAFFVEFLGYGPSFTGLVIEDSIPHRWSEFKAGYLADL